MTVAQNGTNGHVSRHADKFGDADKWRRSFVTPVLPFKSDETVDFDAYRTFIRRFVSDEALSTMRMALIANPEAGELFTLNREEQKQVLRICLEEARGRCPVAAGIVSVTTTGYIEQAKDALELGADALFIFPPIGAMDISTSWNAAKFPEVFTDICKDVAAEVPLPMLVHPVGNATPAYGPGFPIELVKSALDQCPNIVGWKMTYNYSGYRTIANLLASYKRPVAILTAVAAYSHENYANEETDGFVSGSFNYALESMMEHHKLWMAGDFKGATKHWKSGLSQLQMYMFSDFSRLHIRYKIAAYLRGLIPSPLMRRPMPKPRLEEIDILANLLEGAGLSVVSPEDRQKMIKALKINL